MKSKKPSTRGNQSFTKIVRLKDGETCTSLKRHYRNCTREVVGYLDKLASLDAERFVFPTVPTIVKRCNKHRKNNAPFHKRTVGLALTFLRQQLVLSEQVERVRGGVIRRGWIVSHHDAVAVLENGCCDFKGQVHWEREIETERDANGQWQLKKIGPIVHRTVQREMPTVPRTVQRETANCAAHCAAPPLHSSGATNCGETICENGAPPNRGSRALPERATTTNRVNNRAPENGAPVKKAAAVEDSEKANLTKWILDNFNLMGAIGKSRAGLDKLVDTHGAGCVLAALKGFYNRPGEFGGVKNAWALFLSESDDYIAHVKHTQQAYMDADKRNAAAAERHAVEISQRHQAAENWKRLNTPGKAIGKDGNELIECDILSLIVGGPDDYEEFK